jgi:protein TonB
MISRARPPEGRLLVLMLASGLLHVGLLASLSDSLGGHAGRSARAGMIAVARLWEGAEAPSLAQIPSLAPPPEVARALLPVPPEESFSLEPEPKPEPAQDKKPADLDQPQPEPGSGAGEQSGMGEAGEGAASDPTGRRTARWGLGLVPEESEPGVLPSEAVCPKPKYPGPAKERGLEGKGELQFEVLPDGSVGDIFIVKSTGFPVLDQAALENVQKACKFFPGQRQGEPVSMWVSKPFKFDLEEVE